MSLIDKHAPAAPAGPSLGSRRPLLIAVLIGAALVGILISGFNWLADSASWKSLLFEIQAQQRALHQELAAAIRAVKHEGLIAGWTLISLSFLYGIFHAAGPGHGKMVIATYLATQESRLGRGLTLSVLSAFAQAVTAVVLVEVTVTILGKAMRSAHDTMTTLEAASFALVAVLGAALTVMALRRLLRRWNASRHEAGSGHVHGQAACDHCGHAHGPDAATLEQASGWRSQAAIIFSIGIRPCSGGVLVLMLAYVLELRWAGIGAVFAMAAGTAITVSALAIMSVMARRISLRVANALPQSSRQMGLVIESAALCGGLVLLLLGISLVQTAIATGQHPLF